MDLKKSVSKNSMYLELKNKGYWSSKENQSLLQRSWSWRILCWFNSRELIIVELKAVDYIVKDLKTKFWITYKLTDCEVGLFLNFGKTRV
jgi:hypothetical protein